MSDDAQHLFEEALRLSLEERSQLAEQLLRSLDEDEEGLSAADWERMWSDEIARRLREIDAGRAQLVDEKAALARARALLKPRP